MVTSTQLYCSKVFKSTRNRRKEKHTLGVTTNLARLVAVDPLSTQWKQFSLQDWSTLKLITAQVFRRLAVEESTQLLLMILAGSLCVVITNMANLELNLSGSNLLLLW